MNFVMQPWQLLLVILVGWVQRQQQAIIEFQNEQIKTLLETHGKKRIRLTDDQRRRLAVKGKALGRKAMSAITTIVTPDTILRWHRNLVAAKWDYSQVRKKPGRPPVSEEVANLILRMAKENPTWGYNRIQGALANLGHEISDTSVGKILKAHGIEPAPERKQRTSWKTFLKAHWDVLAAVDFTTVEVWTKGGLVTFYLLFVMELKTRRVSFAGCTLSPDGAWMKQVAKNLTDSMDGFLSSSSYLLMDRDAKYSGAFCQMLEQEKVTCLKLPPKSPNLNAHLERFMRSLKSEALDRMIFFGEDSLRRTVASFLEQYHRERNHQGLDNRLIKPAGELSKTSGEVLCSERLGGILRYYHRQAA